MPTFLLLLLGLTAGCTRAQDSSEGIRAVVAAPLKKVRRGPGDPCEDECSPETHTFCDNNTKTCKCDHHYPVVIDNLNCLKPVLLGKSCIHQKQCQFHDIHAICQQYTLNYTECSCRDKYTVKSLEGLAIPSLCLPKTYAAFALAANASTSSSPARDRHHSIRSGSRSASSSRRPSYSSIHPNRPGTRRSSQASLRLVAGEGRGEPIGYYVCIREPVSVHSRAGSRRPSQGSLASRASSSGDLREGRVHHFLYMRAPHHSLTSETTTTTGTSDSSPRTPKSTEQLLAVYHSVPEHTVLELKPKGVGSSHTTSTLGTSSDDVFQEEDEDEEEEEEEEEEQQQGEEETEESKARLIV